MVAYAEIQQVDTNESIDWAIKDDGVGFENQSDPDTSSRPAYHIDFKKQNKRGPVAANTDLS